MTLHVYGQAHNHDSTFIVGTPKALASLRDAITAALLRNDSESCELYAVDGEGYTAIVIPVKPAEAANLRLPYTERSGFGKEEQTWPGTHPEALLTADRYKQLARTPGFSENETP